MSFIAAVFFVMVGILIFYHTYLMINNLTTCNYIKILKIILNLIIFFFNKGENVSWHKISYLKDLPEDKGSPFD